MAKDKESKVDDIYIHPANVERPKKKKGNLIVVIIIILVLIAVVVIFKDPIINVARQIPIIGGLIPKEDSADVTVSAEELKDSNKELEQEIDRLNQEIATLKDDNQDIQSKNQILKKYEEEQENFIKQKNEWDNYISDDNSELFIQQFEEIYPDTAEEIYIRLKGNEIISKEKIKVSTAIGEMDSEQAAKALEVLLTTDIELVKSIMLEMKIPQKSEILDSMSSEGAATVIKLIYP